LLRPIRLRSGKFAKGGMMLKQMRTSLLLTGGFLLATSVMAQGRGSGKPAGGPGINGHGPMGAPSGQSTTKPKQASLALGPAGGSAPGAKSPVSLLDQNSKLESNLAKFFPGGTDLLKEAAGFKNLGQFVSAVHVSHNLGIPFDNLKCAELGTTAATQEGVSCSTTVTNSNPISLGKSIQTLRPDAKPEQAIKEANQQAEKDLQETAQK
jgi:hypothetical protein